MSEDNSDYKLWGPEYAITIIKLAAEIRSDSGLAYSPQLLHVSILRHFKNLLGVTPTNAHVTPEELKKFGSGLSKKKIGHVTMCPLCRVALPAALARPSEEVALIVEAIYFQLGHGEKLH